MPWNCQKMRTVCEKQSTLLAMCISARGSFDKNDRKASNALQLLGTAHSISHSLYGKEEWGWLLKRSDKIGRNILHRQVFKTKKLINKEGVFIYSPSKLFKEITASKSALSISPSWFTSEVSLAGYTAIWSPDSYLGKKARGWVFKSCKVQFNYGLLNKSLLSASIQHAKPKQKHIMV